MTTTTDLVRELARVSGKPTQLLMFVMERARSGFYRDSLQKPRLAADLRRIGLNDLAKRVSLGEFDETPGKIP